MSKQDLVPNPDGRVPAEAPLGRRRRPRVPDLSRLPNRPSARGRGYGDFLSVADAFVETPPSRLHTVAGYVLCGVVLLFLCWSLFSDLTMFAIAPGSVAPQAGTQVVEPRVAGSVAVVRVKDGDTVAAGDPLLRLDDTVAVADRAIVRSKIGDLKAEVARRAVAMAAARKDPVGVGDTVAWDPDTPAAVRARENDVLRSDLAKLAATVADLGSQRAAKVTARDRFTANIAAETSLIEARTESTGMHQQLADKGWESRAEVLQKLEPLRQEQVTLTTLQGSLAEVEAAIPVLDREIADARQSFVTDNALKSAAAQRQLDGLEQQLVQAEKAVDDTVLKASAAGTVHGLAVTTVGQAVKPGQQLLQIVPSGSPVEIVAYVLNTDIGFVKVGQPATIKVDSFPFTRYGTIAGRVVKVAPDAVPGRAALMEERDDAAPTTRGPLSATSPTQQLSDLVFPVVIRPDRDWIAVDGRQTPLLPGMTLAVEIETERQRAIGYILYPLLRALPQH